MATPQQPTLGGFVTFLGLLGVPASAGFSPSTDATVTWAYDAAVQTVNPMLCTIPGVPGAWTMHARAVYNLAADFLINWEVDPVDAPAFRDDLQYWAWLRKSFGCLEFSPGVVSSTGDEGTNTSLQVPEALSQLTLANLQNLKTPYGRAYLGIAQSWGTNWGIN